MTNPIPFQTIDWEKIARTTHDAVAGKAAWQTAEYPGIRLRIVEYTPGFASDEWCTKGHIVHCLDGALAIRLETGEEFTLSKGMTYIVTDNMSAHQGRSPLGVRLLIVDGDFLK